MRPAPAGFAVYMLRRSARSRFMPAVYVFPGGAVDAADASAATLGRLCGYGGLPGPQYAVAALRELFEEAGILLACDDDGQPANLAAGTRAALRRERAAGADLTPLLSSHGLRLDARNLLYYSNWITPQSEPIRFDAHFFVALAPAGQVAEADAVEVHDGEWVVPADALARADRGEFAIIFPTRKHLERLAACPDIDSLMAHARARAVRPIEPIPDMAGGFAFASDDDTW